MKTSKKNTLFSEFVKMDINNSMYKHIRDYAEHIGISYTVIYDMLNGKYDSPTALSASRMCKWFHIEPEKLFELIKGVDDKFIKEFNYYYYKEYYDDICKSNIEFLFKMHNHDELFDEEPFEENPRYDYSINNLKIINTNEKAMYDGHSYNATGTYTIFEIEPEFSGKNIYDIDYSGRYYSKESSSYDFALYYLAPRRINKESENTYPDERIRDFTTKLLHIVTDIDAPSNNIFYTTSKKLYDEILHYTNTFNIKYSNGNGVGLLCYQYKHNLYYESIIENNELINGNLF